MLISCVSVCSLLQLQWKQDLEMGLELISKAIEIDNKCDFAYETMGTIEVQRFVMPKCYIASLKYIFFLKFLICGSLIMLKSLCKR